MFSVLLILTSVYTALVALVRTAIRCHSYSLTRIALALLILDLQFDQSTATGGEGGGGAGARSYVPLSGWSTEGPPLRGYRAGSTPTYLPTTGSEHDLAQSVLQATLFHDNPIFGPSLRSSKPPTN